MDKLIKFNVTIVYKEDGTKDYEKFNITQKYKTKKKSEIITGDNYGFLCGKVSDVVVIDVDIKNGKDGVKALLDLGIDMNKYNTYTVKTRHGFHYYFKYNNKWSKSYLLHKLGIDILSNKLNCFAGKGYDVINDVEFKELSDELYNAIYPKCNTPTKKSKKQILPIVANDSIIPTTTEYNEVIAKVNKINPKWIDEYSTWIVGAKCIKLLIKDDTLALKAFLYYCNKSFHIRKFEESDLIKQFNNFKTDVKPNSLDILINKVDESNEDILELKLLRSPFDDTTIIEYFLKVNDNYKSYNNTLYYFNGNNWIKGDSKYLIADIDSMYRKLYNYIQSKYEDEELGKILKKILVLRSIKYKENLIKGIVGYVSVDKDLWDLNDDLIGFKNGVYDLLNDTFRSGTKEDYISMIINYEYKESTNEELNNVKEHFNKIMPVKEERDLLLLLLSTCLSGRHLEKFIVCTGKGRNSKDALFTYLLERTIGPYYYRLNNTAITQTIKGDQNQSIANANKKRAIITTEPDQNVKVKTGMVKELTGGKSIAMRGIYSNDTHVNLNETLFMLCNDKPDLDRSDDAMLSRLIVIPFRSTFMAKELMDEDGIKEGENNVFAANENVKSDQFLDNMKLPFMNLMLEYFKIFRNNGYLIQTLPESIKALNALYLEESDEFMNWFNSEYEKTNSKSDIVKINEIFSLYKLSEFYTNLTKEQKRKNNKSKFIEMIQNNVSLKIFFKERLFLDGVNYRTIITNYKERNDDNNE